MDLTLMMTMKKYKKLEYPSMMDVWVLHQITIEAEKILEEMKQYAT